MIRANIDHRGYQPIWVFLAISRSQHPVTWMLISHAGYLGWWLHLSITHPKIDTRGRNRISGFSIVVRTLHLWFSVYTPHECKLHNCSGHVQSNNAWGVFPYTYGRKNTFYWKNLVQRLRVLQRLICNERRGLSRVLHKKWLTIVTKHAWIDLIIDMTILRCRLRVPYFSSGDFCTFVKQLPRVLG